MFHDLLRRKKNEILISISNEGSDSEHYSAETKLLKKALSLERESMIGGLLMGFGAFISLRYGPRTLLRAIGGEKKIQALREAESKAKEAPYAMFRRAGGKFYFMQKDEPFF